MSGQCQSKVWGASSHGKSRTPLFFAAIVGLCATSVAMSLGGARGGRGAQSLPSGSPDAGAALERTLDDYRAISLAREERLQSFRIAFVEEDAGSSSTWADRSEFVVERQGDLWYSSSAFMPGPLDAPTTASVEVHAAWNDSELVVAEPAHGSGHHFLDERGFEVWGEFVPSAGVTFGMLQLPSAATVAEAVKPGLATDPLAGFLRFGELALLEPGTVMAATGLAQVVHLVDIDGGNRATIWLDVTTGLVVRFSLGGFEWRVEEIAWLDDVPMPKLFRRGSVDAWAWFDRGMPLPTGSAMVTGLIDEHLSHVALPTGQPTAGTPDRGSRAHIAAPIDIVSDGMRVTRFESAAARSPE
jgi:hypothetical protein